MKKLSKMKKIDIVKSAFKSLEESGYENVSMKGFCTGKDIPSDCKDLPRRSDEDWPGFYLDADHFEAGHIYLLFRGDEYLHFDVWE